ncbi:MAG TPA: PEP-CTERM sorting domain-containing protein [Fimbriimonadaceae bacterium]|nr:PEP-CTERM sorting domain-containing protein [Fimbriimonadaceae bacterium]
MYKRFAFSVALIAACALSQADYFGQYGNVNLVNDGPNGTAYQITSDNSLSTAWGGVYYVPNAGTTLNDLTTVSSDFSWLQGTFGGGAPRFSLGLTNGSVSHEAWVYWGTGPSYTDNPGAGWQNTGNLLASPDNRFDTSSFSSFGGQYGDNAAHMFSILGSWTVQYVSLDLDGGWSQTGGIQQMNVTNFQVNGATIPVPEPASMAALAIGGLALLRRRRSSGKA